MSTKPIDLTLEYLDEATAKVTIKDVPHVGTITQTGKRYAFYPSTLGGLIGDWLRTFENLWKDKLTAQQVADVYVFMLDAPRTYMMRQAATDLLDWVKKGFTPSEALEKCEEEYRRLRKLDESSGGVADIATELASKIEARSVPYLFAELPPSEQPLNPDAKEVYRLNNLSLCKCCDKCDVHFIAYVPTNLALFSIESMDSFRADENNPEQMKRYLWWFSAFDLSDAVRVNPRNSQQLQYRDWASRKLGEMLDAIEDRDWKAVDKILGGKVELNSIRS